MVMNDVIINFQDCSIFMELSYVGVNEHFQMRSIIFIRYLSNIDYINCSRNLDCD